MLFFRHEHNCEADTEYFSATSLGVSFVSDAIVKVHSFSVEGVLADVTRFDWTHAMTSALK